MTRFTRHDLPADVAVFAGDFASQPLVFAHLLDEAPDLDLGHVEVIQSNHTARLAAYFSPVPDLPTDRTLVLILPAAYPGLICPITETTRLTPLGTRRGTVPHLTEARP